MFVSVRAREVAPAEAAARHFEGKGDRFIKRVAAVGGQRVCGEATQRWPGCDRLILPRNQSMLRVVP